MAEEASSLQMTLASAKPSALGKVVAVRDPREHSRAVPTDSSLHALQAAPLMLIATSRDGAVTLVNDVACRVAGYSEAEFRSASVWRLLYPGDLYNQVEDLFDRLAAQADVSDYPMTLETRDGRRRVVSWNSRNRYDVDGRLVEILGVGIDITNWEQKSRELARAEERLSEVQRIARVGCWELDLVTDRYWWSYGALQLLELNADESVDRYEEFLELLDEADRARFDSVFRKSISDFTEYDLTYGLQLRNGRHRYLRSRGHISFSASGAAVRTFGTLQDVTAEIERDSALQESLRRAQQLSEYTERVVENSPAFIAAIAPDGAAVSINDAGCRFLERDRESVIGNDLWKMMYPGKYYAQVTRLFREFAGAGGIHNYEMTMCSASGQELILDWTSLNRYNPDRRLLEIIMIGQDVTSLRQSREQLSEIQRIAGIGGWEHEVGSGRLVWSDEAAYVLAVDGDSIGDTVEQWMALIHPDDRQRVKGSYTRFLLGEDDYTATYRVCLPGGQIRHVQGRATPQRDASGRVMRVIGTIQDLTTEVERQEQFQAALLETVRLKDYTEHVVENSPSLIVATAPGGEVTAINPAGLRILGCGAEHIIGAHLWQTLCPREKYAQVERMLETRDASGTTHDFEIVIENLAGEARVMSWTSVDRLDETGKLIEAVGIATDITDLQQSQGELQYLAHHDPLTGLPNRLLLSARLERALEIAREQGTTGGLLYIDLDRFKIINDSLGHTAGDALLKAAAGRLKNCVRASDTVARLGGDEFTLLLHDIRDGRLALITARKVLAAFENPFHIEGHEIYVTPSIGISVFPRDGEDIESILRNADSAMYEAKSNGRNGFAQYTRRLTTEALERVELENELRRAIENEQLVVHYQPQVALATGTLIGAEALVRWNHPERGLVAPNAFVPIAEETGMIVALGEWVLRDTCRTVKRWHDNGLPLPRVAVNLAGAQIRRRDLARSVGALLAEMEFPVSLLELEVTEGFIMSEAESAIDTLDELRELGIRLSIDDFGTGYSSLSYLKRLPINQLKIDRSFVKDITHDADDLAITGAIIALAKSLRLELVAEGVETEAQRQLLLDHGCLYGQGYLFSRPLVASEFEAFARTHGVALQ